MSLQWRSDFQKQARHSFLAFLTFVFGVTSLFPLYGLLFALAALVLGTFELLRMHHRRSPPAVALVVSGMLLAIASSLIFITLFFRAFGLMSV